MKIEVLAERCVGHGMCHLACPDVFALNDDDGLAIVLADIVPPEHRASVDQALRGCPEGAIVIVK